jgi:hypothetical protein
LSRAIAESEIVLRPTLHMAPLGSTGWPSAREALKSFPAAAGPLQRPGERAQR